MYNVEKYIPKKTPPSFRHKVDYEGDTNEKTRGSDNSSSENDDCLRNLNKEYEMKRMNNSKKILLW